ncbi:hypothetical protein BLNAU_10457 [Blattamonas nauphoetae]|uniref:Uncharacterized protein n=1 Tax=Blattamonas nauphoetae TaxID=2049346 RepID=A0ABQ9XQ93_9EUKA|nr:hypothetical protein BLNAU_10457 [Blattamonas nauphoetae]
MFSVVTPVPTPFSPSPADAVISDLSDNGLPDEFKYSLDFSHDICNRWEDQFSHSTTRGIAASFILFVLITTTTVICVSKSNIPLNRYTIPDTFDAPISFNLPRSHSFFGTLANPNKYNRLPPIPILSS